MRVCLGGTFDPFHIGHEALLRAAATPDATHLFIGITQGELAQRPDRQVAPVAERAARIEAFLDALGYQGDVVTKPLEDGVGPATNPEYDRIVVSYETAKAADAINKRRRAAGHAPLDVVVVPPVLGADRLPVSATAIASGRIDRQGQRLRPVQVAVGSANPVKVEAARLAMRQFLGDQAFEIAGHPVASGAPEQPKGDETMAGAQHRAMAALEAAPDADYAVGIEAGLVQMPGSDGWWEVQAYAIVDRTGHSTSAWGPGFRYPDWITERALAGEMVSEILGPVANDPRIGGTTGAIGFLSDGLMDRTELTRIGVVAALVPRVRPWFYLADPV
ncbi:MAG: inosine/xanthosine triphosphatase [Thermoplasmatota archaeon]